MKTEFYSTKNTFKKIKFLFVTLENSKFFSKKFSIEKINNYPFSFFPQKKKFYKNKIILSLDSLDKKSSGFNKEIKLTRKNFLINFLLLWIVNKPTIANSENFLKKDSEKLKNFFEYNYSQENKQKNNSQNFNRTGVLKKFSKYIFKKEKDLEKIDTISRFFLSFFLMGLMVISGISSSERFSNKIELPESYSPNQINSYYKLRPEKIMSRLSQIFVEILKLTFGLFKDYIEYPKTETLKNEASQDFKFYKFIFQNSKKFFSFLSFLNFSSGEIFSNFFIISRISNIYQISQFRSSQKKKKFWKIKWDNRAKQLRETIAKLSPAFIKLAQALSSRPDLVDERLSKELQRLQDDMPFFPNEEAFNFIKKELGATPEKIFSDISSEPVAAASLGQVYKATLDGIQVAVKVQRPGLLELIALDIFVIRFLAKMAQKIFKVRTDLVSIIDEYAERLFEELDYRKESSNMIKFRSLYGYMDMLCIPRVFLEYSSRHVLVMEWIEGDRLVKNSVKTMQEDVSLIEIGVRCSLVQLLETGFLHCDPHGGNLIKTKDGKLAYLDFGLVSEIPETVRYSLISAILNLINREYESLAKDFNGMALIRSDDLDKEISKISYAFFEIFDKSLSNFDKFTFQDISEKIFRLTVNFPFILPPYFLNNLRAIATLEGLALTADPNFKIADVIYPYIINKLLTNSAPQFQASLEDFLIDAKTKKPNWNRLEALLQDPEWTETFSDQSVNLSDTLLNFIISPTGNFLRNLIIQTLLELGIKKIFMGYYLFKKKISLKFSGNIKNIDFQLKENSELYDMQNSEIIFPNFKGSKIYNWNTFFLLSRACMISTIVIISEFFFKFMLLFFEFLIEKIPLILNLKIRSGKN